METPCREWQGSRTWFGYGSIWREGRTWVVHRWVWTLANGPIPEGMRVLHRCDNPPCFRLDHLFLGTHQDNMTDMVEKGRSMLCGVRLADRPGFRLPGVYVYPEGWL